MMNDVRRKQFELLVELDQICQEHKIPYCLFGYTAWQAYTKHEFIEGNMLPPEVAMLPEAARAFIDAFNAANPEGRFIEYMGNNYKFDRLDIRYGDSNTLDFAPNYAHYYENHGLHVTIHVMCYGYTKGLYNKMHTVLANDVAFNIRRTPYEKKHLAFHRARQVWSTVSGRQREAKSLFNYLLDGGKRDKTKVLYKPYDRRHQTFPAYWFSDTIQADLEGHLFPVPSMYDLYFARLYGKGWEDAEPSVRNPDPELRIFDADIPFADWLARNGMKSHVASYGKRRTALNAEQGKIKVYSSKNGAFWDKVRRSGMRYKLWEEYMPQKAEIQALVDAGDYKAASKRLGRYLRQLDAFSRKDLGLCFDAEMFALAERCLVHEGKYVYAAKLRSQVPKQHWKSIGQNLDNYLQKEPKVFAEATEADLNEIRAFTERDVSKGVYMYIDVRKYGLNNPHMKLWVLRSANTNRINAVVMKYHDSMSIVADESVVDLGFFADLVNELKPTMVSGELELIKKAIPLLEADYEVEEGWVYDITDYRLLESDVGIERAYLEDMAEAARLISEEWPYYDRADLEGQLRQRLSEGMARNFKICKDGKMVAHICTYAEYAGIGVTAGLVVDEDYRDMPYGTFLESHLVDSMRNDGLKAYTFVTSKKRTRLFDAMGGKELSRYGKLTMDA